MARHGQGAWEDVQTGCQQATEAGHARTGFRCSVPGVLRHLQRHGGLRHRSVVVWSREGQWWEWVATVQRCRLQVSGSCVRRRKLRCTSGWRRQLRGQRRMIDQHFRIWNQNGHECFIEKVNYFQNKPKSKLSWLIDNAIFLIQINTPFRHWHAGIRPEA